jgi:hypothetical protein
MCEECEAPVQFVAYFNKPGGKLWRPPRLSATAPESTAARAGVPVLGFSCDDPAAPREPAPGAGEQETTTLGKLA